MKEQFNALLSTGFPTWTATAYQQFFRSFLRHEIGDVEAYAKDIESKTVEEVTAYFNVFMHRFRELKESDQVILKFQKKDFDEMNLETIREFDETRADDYVVLLQENHYFNRNSYLSVISKAHDKLAGTHSNSKLQGGLQLRLDHFMHAQPKHMIQE